MNTGSVTSTSSRRPSAYSATCLNGRANRNRSTTNDGRAKVTAPVSTSASASSARISSGRIKFRRTMAMSAALLNRIVTRTSPIVRLPMSGHQHIHEHADVVKLFQTLHQFDHLANVLTLQHAIGAILELVLQGDGRERIGRMALRMLDRRAERAAIPERDRHRHRQLFAVGAPVL